MRPTQEGDWGKQRSTKVHHAPQDLSKQFDIQFSESD